MEAEHPTKETNQSTPSTPFPVSPTQRLNQTLNHAVAAALLAAGASLRGAPPNTPTASRTHARRHAARDLLPRAGARQIRRRRRQERLLFPASSSTTNQLPATSPSRPSLYKLHRTGPAAPAGICNPPAGIRETPPQGHFHSSCAAGVLVTHLPLHSLTRTFSTATCHPEANDVPWSTVLEVVLDCNPDLLLPATSAPGSLHHLSEEWRAAGVAPEDNHDFLDGHYQVAPRGQ